MDGVSIENSLGYGFLGLNVLGQSQFVRSSFIANNQFMKDTLMKTNVGSLRCNGTDYDYNTAYFNNVSTDCSAAIFGGSMHLHFDDSSHVSSSNQLSFSHLVFSLGVDGTFGPQCSENRGTGLSIKLAQTTFTVTFDIHHSKFYRNQAYEGAGINIEFETSANNTVTLTNVSLIRGLAFIGGAGMELTINTQSNSLSMINATGLIFECNCVVDNAQYGSTFDVAFKSAYTQLCNSLTLVLLHSIYFSSNIGIRSLGILFDTYLIPEIVYNSSVEIVNCTFMDTDILQTHYSVYAQSYYAINPTILLYKSFMTNSSVSFNRVNVTISDVLFTSSKVWAINSVIVFNGTVVFRGCSKEENGGALYLLSSSAVTAQKSHLMFINNTALLGGAVFIDSQSKLIFTSPCKASFINNEALLKGGALYVQTEPNSPPCFFKVNYTNFQFNGNFGVFLYFEGNSAGEAGSVLYGGDIDNCTLDITLLPYPYSIPGYITSGSFFDNITEFGPNDNSSALISSDPLLFSMCYNTLSTPEWNNYTGYPGQSINLSFITMGQRGSITPAVVIVYTILPVVKIFKVLYTTKHCADYTISIENINRTLMFTTELALIENLQNMNEASIKLSITVNLPCPNGFELDYSIPSCVCNPLLHSYGFDCNIKNETVLKFGNEWIGYSRDKSLVVVAQCPFDYCSDNKFISIHDYDSQCNFNRSNVLCGRCNHNLSMVFGTSQCTECSNDHLLLVIPFAILGVVLVFLLFTLDLTVISGMLNGLIFYANVFRINGNIFIPSIRTTRYTQLITIVIAWLNLDFGIETCFYSGMDSIAKTWLQFVFPIYILSLVSVIIVIGRHSSTVARIKAVPVVATLMQLSYSKLVRTIITIFSFCQFNAPNSSVSYIWIYDGNVIFEGSHVVLFIFGLLVTIVFIIPYTLLLLLAPFLQTRSHRYGCHWIHKFKPFLDCYYAPFKDRYRFWTGVLPVIRLPLYLVFILSQSPTIKLWVIIIVIYIYVIALITLSVYKKWFVSLLEVFFLVNISAICVVALNDPISNMIGLDIVVTLVTIALFVFLGIVGYHAVKNRHLNRCVLHASRMCRARCISNEVQPLLDSDANSAAEVLREPLLEDN